jgi:cyclophilin family peptidyl-prolyl cis-trans isomerase
MRLSKPLMKVPFFQSSLTLLVSACFLSLEAAPPVAPSDFIFAKSEADDSASFEWVDNSTDETFFQFEITIGDGAAFLQNGPGTDSTGFTFTGFTPGSGVTFRLRAAKPLEGGGAGALESSEWTAPLVVITENLNFYASAVTGTPGETLSYVLEKDFECDSITIMGALPTWLSFDEASRTFSAVNPLAGSVRVSFQAVKGIHERSGFLYFNIINEGPEVLVSPEPLTIIAEPSLEVDLTTFFKDPDMIRAAAVATDFGDMAIGFYEGFPVTVDNFFAYVESDAWDGAFFHRMAKLGTGENFVLQGGGFKPNVNPGTYTRVEQLATIVNEFDVSRPNLCGTISMAKLGGDPDSATNQFFISLNDNRAILDGQNGGFTVFGRATNIAPANRMSALDRGDFTVDIDGSMVGLNDWPLTMIDGSSPAFDQLASMNDVFEIPTLAYSFSFAGDDVVSAAVASTVGAPLIITPKGSTGETQLTLTATDLDGASVSVVFPVTVLNSYDTWAASKSASGPNENSDAGHLTNFEEYAYGGDPTNPADDPFLLPFAGLGSSGHGVFTFRHRDNAPDLSYLVQVSEDLVTWAPVWTSADGFDSSSVIEVVDGGELKSVTVRGDDLVRDKEDLFFRLVVNPEPIN